MSPTNETKHPQDQTYYPPAAFDRLRKALEPTVSDEQIKALSDNEVASDSLAALLKESLAAREASVGRTAPQTLCTLSALSIACANTTEAETYYRTTIARYKDAGESRGSLSTQYNLGCYLNTQGRYAEAEGVLRPALVELEKRIGVSSQQYIGCLRETVTAVGAQGKSEEAVKLFEEGKKILSEAYWTDEDKEKHAALLEKAYKSASGVEITAAA